MNSIRMTIIFFAAALAVLCIVLAVLYARQRKNMDALVQSIEEFMDTGETIDFSTADNDFARLQNSVADLENIINIEKRNTLVQTKKNTEFISDISHQLKTPLAGLRLYCEMENAEKPTVHTQKELQLIEKMENLIQKLLRLEKIKSDSYVMDFKLWDMGDIVNETVNPFYHIFPQKHFVITGSGKLRCDREWMIQAMSNVIKNACEHTAADGTVTVLIENNEQSTIIEISDNGGGIAEDKVSDLFTRFFKSENSLPQSAGIGLAITKAIVEKHHGMISAENKNGGLCITMCFPHMDGYETI